MRRTTSGFAPFRWGSLLLVGSLTLACGDAHPADLNLEVASAAGGGAGEPEHPFRPYGVGEDRGPGICWGGASRVMDFWIGRWDLTDNDMPIGTNEIRRGLGGCVLTESYAGPMGVRGRSFSAYDHGSGAWLQTYVSELDASTYRLDGNVNADGTSVTMEGPRLFILPSGNLFPVVDRVTWTDAGPDGPTHVAELSTDGGQTFPFVISDLVYTHANPYQPADPMGSDACTGDEFRALDAWIGRWKVQVDGKVVGTSIVSRKLSGCVIEERFRARGGRGYQTWSLMGYDPTTSTWHRTYVDNVGNAFRWEQEPGGEFVLEGSRANTDGTMVSVANRFTFSNGQVVQTFSVQGTDASSLTLTYGR